MRLKSIILCIGLAPVLLAANEPIRLQPSSPWNVDYAQNSCRLARTFGDGTDKTTLIFESAAPEDMTMLVTGAPLATGVREVPAKFGPSDNKSIRGRLAETKDGGLPAILWSDVALLPDSLSKPLQERARQARERPSVRPAPIDLKERDAVRGARLAFASAVREIEIDPRQGKSVFLETGSLGEAVKVFDLCTRDALHDAGVDPGTEDKIVRPVWTPQPIRWLEGSYPGDMIRRNQEAEVSARLLVDQTGRVTSCTSLSYFDEPEFNKAVCDKFMALAHFSPAELADGTKVPSYYTAHVIFRVGR